MKDITVKFSFSSKEKKEKKERRKNEARKIF